VLTLRGVNVRLEPWSKGDRPLLDQVVGDPAMMEHLGGLGEEEFEFPPGNPMRCNDWRLDLGGP
jgi:hypothetical protein